MNNYVKHFFRDNALKFLDLFRLTNCNCIITMNFPACYIFRFLHGCQSCIIKGRIIRIKGTIFIHATAVFFCRFLFLRKNNIFRFADRKIKRQFQRNLAAIRNFYGLCNGYMINISLNRMGSNYTLQSSKTRRRLSSSLT